MQNGKAILDYLASSESEQKIQLAIESDRQEEMAFRRDLVKEFNNKLKAEGRYPTVHMLETQERFVTLSMASDEVQKMAAEYAKALGRRLPPPPPSLTLDDI